MRQRLFVGIVVAGMSLSVGGVVTEAQAPAMRTVMQHKLEDAQRLLRAVVMSDFVQIDRGAERLSRITDMEISSWQTPGQPEYTRQAVAFISPRGRAGREARLDQVARRPTTERRCGSAGRTFV
jgi:hypothetical protein